MRPGWPIGMEEAVELAGLVPFRPGSSPPRRILVVGHQGVRNLGADLRTQVLLGFLAAQPSPGFEVEITSYAPGEAACDFGNVRQCLLPVQGGGALWRMVSAADAVIVNEGCALAPSAYRQFAGAMAIARRQGKPAIGLGLGADSSCRPGVAWVAGAAQGSILFARDGASLDRLLNEGLAARAGADPAWAISPPEPVGVRRQGVVVCPSNAGAWPQATRAAFPSWIAALKAVCRDTEATVLTMEAADAEVAADVAAATGARLAAGHRSADAALQAFRSAQAVVSARYHGLVLGMHLGALPIGLAIDARITSLMAESPFAHFSIAVASVSGIETLGTAVEAALGSTAKRRDELKAFAGEQRRRAAVMLEAAIAVLMQPQTAS